MLGYLGTFEVFFKEKFCSCSRAQLCFSSSCRRFHPEKVSREQSPVSGLITRAVLSCPSSAPIWPLPAEGLLSCRLLFNSNEPGTGDNAILSVFKVQDSQEVMRMVQSVPWCPSATFLQREYLALTTVSGAADT